MKAHGFTLIEIMASLLIFAIGGSMALSVFNFNAGNRVDIAERMEAMEIANNKLQTLLLRAETVQPGDNTWLSTGSGGNIRTDGVWITPEGDAPHGNDTTPGDSAIINIQQWNKDGSPVSEWERRGVRQLEGSVSSLKGSDDASDAVQISQYEWRFRLATYNEYPVRRTVLNGEVLNPADDTVKYNINSGLYFLTVEVSWPNTETDFNERKKVTVHSVITCK